MNREQEEALINYLDTLKMIEYMRNDGMPTMYVAENMRIDLHIKLCKIYGIVDYSQAKGQ